MRMTIKRLLKKHGYPPNEIDGTMHTVMTQCELWTDHQELETPVGVYEPVFRYGAAEPDALQAAEDMPSYGGERK